MAKFVTTNWLEAILSYMANANFTAIGSEGTIIEIDDLKLYIHSQDEIVFAIEDFVRGSIIGSEEQGDVLSHACLMLSFL